MDGNEQAEIDFLKQECIDFGARMRSASCTKNEALYSFNASLLPKLEYAMPVTDISESQWDNILAPALIPSLQKASISKNIARCSLFGPRRYQGFNIKHPYFNQQKKHIATLIQEVLSCSQTGLILRATAEQLRLELGLPFDTTTTSYSICSSYITPTWYSNLWKFFSTNSSIEITEDFPDLPTLHKGDRYLMDLFIKAGYRGRNLRLLNEI